MTDFADRDRNGGGDDLRRDDLRRDDLRRDDVRSEPSGGAIERGLDDETVAVRVVDQSGVGVSRRVARSMGESVSLDGEKVEKLALAVSEAAMNQLRHAGGGEILLTRLRASSPGDRVRADGGGVEMLAVDGGPGIVKLGRALRKARSQGEGSRDESPPGRGLGIGLGSIRRLSDEFAIHAPPGLGTVVLARMWNRPPAAEPYCLKTGAVSRARRGQTVCGDAWRLHRSGENTYHLMVVDGLGHGRVAAVASRAALEGLKDVKAATPPVDVLRSAHGCAAGTRGAAALVVRLRTLSGEVDVSGVGNVQGALWTEDRWKGFPTQPGTLGIEPLRFRQTTYSWRAGEPFVIHTDGLSSRWPLDDLPGLRRLHPSLVAASLYRDYGYDHDDTTVFVGRLGRRNPAPRHGSRPAHGAGAAT